MSISSSFHTTQRPEKYSSEDEVVAVFPAKQTTAQTTTHATTHTTVHTIAHSTANTAAQTGQSEIQSPVMKTVYQNHPLHEEAKAKPISLLQSVGVQALPAVAQLAGKFFTQSLKLGKQACGRQQLQHYAREELPKDWLGKIDASWLIEAFGSKELQDWAQSVTQIAGVSLSQGTSNYANALMKTIFDTSNGQQTRLPPLIRQFCLYLDKLILESAINCNLTIKDLNNISSRMFNEFLLAGVLLPCFRDPLFIQQKESLVYELLELDLFKNFQKYAEDFHDNIMSCSEAALSPQMKEQLQTIETRDTAKRILGSHWIHVGNLSPEVLDSFLKNARVFMENKVNDKKFQLECLLEIHLSYPHLMSKKPLLQNEFQNQRRLWLRDVEFLLQHTQLLDKLSEPGKYYFLRKLEIKAIGAYRPQRSEYDLEKFLKEAQRQLFSLYEAQQ